MGQTYRVDWLADDDQTILAKDYGDNRTAAQAFARRKSGTPDKPGPSCYVVKQVCGRDVGQWLYTSGFTQGYDD